MVVTGKRRISIVILTKANHENKMRESIHQTLGKQIPVCRGEALGVGNCQLAASDGASECGGRLMLAVPAPRADALPTRFGVTEQARTPVHIGSGNRSHLMERRQCCGITVPCPKTRRRTNESIDGSSATT